MDAQLLIWIVERYTKVGETVLDPMAGQGTMMLACGLGRNVVLVELEEKFCKMMRDNWEEVKMRPQLGYPMGNCQIIQGDARQLEGLLVDKCIFSPPYAEAQSGGGLAVGLYTGKKGHSPNSFIGERAYTPTTHGNSEGQIGNLPYGSIDKIVTSPPYADSPSSQQSSKNVIEDRIKRNIAGAKVTEGGKYMTGGGKRLEEYSDNPDNLGNLPYGNIDAVVTSPPYEGSLSEAEGRKQSVNEAKYADGWRTSGVHSQPLQAGQYGSSADNIGNLKSSSYLEAMLQIYAQCWSILKDGGLMILVTKNFIRQKQVIRLDTDTVKLCEQAGFTYLERHYRKLPSQSFWRIIYHQKHPEVEQILHEDVLVFRKVMELKV